MTAVWIRNLRIQMRLTQSEFASRLGTTTGTIYRWESGKMSPRRMSRKLLAQVAAAERARGLSSGSINGRSK